MKYQLKLNKHLDIVIENNFIIFDKDDNELMINRNPEYILEQFENAYYLYPKGFHLFKDYFYCIACKFCNLSDILHEIKIDEKIEIYKISEIKERLHRNRKLSKYS